jgi:DNA-binding protein YbaB
MTAHDNAVLQARDDAERLAQQLSAAQQAVGPTTGTDESGLVQVGLDADGAIESVHVDGAWSTRIMPSGLAAAVFAAIAAAGEQRLGAWAEQVAEATERPTRSRPLDDPDFLDRVIASAGGTVETADVQQLVDRLQAALDDVTERLERMAVAVHTARSSDGHVQATCHVSGEVSALEYDEAWLTHAHSFNIGRETLAAITAAHRQATAQSLRAALTDSPIGRLQELLGDPEALGAALRTGTL